MDKIKFLNGELESINECDFSLINSGCYQDHTSKTIKVWNLISEQYPSSSKEHMDYYKKRTLDKLEFNYEEECYCLVFVTTVQYEDDNMSTNSHYEPIPDKLYKKILKILQ